MTNDVKITLDSNVWHDQLFITFLQSDQSSHSQHICPILVYLETRLWYDMKGLNLKDFSNDLLKLKTKVIDFSKIHIEFIIDITKKSKLPFPQHAREIMIGSIVYTEKSILITNNIRHFPWLPPHLVITPKNYLNENQITKS